jgi:hypothetical protein
MVEFSIVESQTTQKGENNNINRLVDAFDIFAMNHFHVQERQLVNVKGDLLPISKVGMEENLATTEFCEFQKTLRFIISVCQLYPL